MSGMIVYGVCNNCYSNDKTYTLNTVTSYKLLVSYFSWFYILVSTEIMKLFIILSPIAYKMYP